MSEDDALTAMVRNMPSPQELVAAEDTLLRGFRRRDSSEIFMVAIFVAAAYEECQREGKSFRGWVREHMSVSLPTAYRLVKIGQRFSKQ